MFTCRAGDRIRTDDVQLGKQTSGNQKSQLISLNDQAFSALTEDLEVRGLLESTLVVAMGEFGRTPKINGAAGRPHWPDCYTVVLAGGGVRGGAVYGASDRRQPQLHKARGHE